MISFPLYRLCLSWVASKPDIILFFSKKLLTNKVDWGIIEV